MMNLKSIFKFKLNNVEMNTNQNPTPNKTIDALKDDAMDGTNIEGGGNDVIDPGQLDPNNPLLSPDPNSGTANGSTDGSSTTVVHSSTG